jgi:hypothetical protein
MKRYTPQISLGLAALVLSALAVPALLAGNPVCRDFDFTIDHVLRDDYQVDGFTCFTAVGTGHASYMGNVTFVNQVSGFGMRAASVRVIKAANGDLLVLSHQSEYNPDAQRFEGTFEIIGGTGRFENATGGGDHIQGEGSIGTICY